jgi:hypothetical protein
MNRFAQPGHGLAQIRHNPAFARAPIDGNRIHSLSPHYIVNALGWQSLHSPLFAFEEARRSSGHR